MEIAAERGLDPRLGGVDGVGLRQGAARVFRRALEEAGAIACAVAAPEIGGIGQMQAFASRKAARIAQHEIVILRAVEALAQSAQRRQAVAAKEGEMVRVVHAGQQRGIEGGLQEQIDRPQATIGDDFVRVEKKAARGGGQGAPNPIERERRQRIVVIEERQPRRARSRDAGVRRRGDAAICGMPQDAQIRRLGMAIEPVAGRLGLRTVVAQNQFPGARPLRAHRGDQFVEIPWMGVEDRNDERNKRRCERRPIGLLGGERDDVGEKRGGAGPTRPQLQPRRQVFEGAAKRIDNVSSHLVTRPKMQSTCGRRFPSMEFHFYIRSAPIFGSGKLVELRQCTPWRNRTLTQKLQLSAVAPALAVPSTL